MKLWRRFTRLFTRLTAQPYQWPALDITLPGDRFLHLVGSIHMGTPEMAPLALRLQMLLSHADALIVEADITQSVSPFTPPMTPCPTLRERLTPSEWESLNTLIEKLNLDLQSVDNLPLWQVALMIQAFQARRLGLSPDYGIDLQLLQAAHQRGVKVLELEGATSQLNLLMQLPDDGHELLADTLTHWHTNARLLQLMIGWWLEPPPGKQNISLPNTFSNGLYEVLMVNRNRQWYDYLNQLSPGYYVVAVGALHLYGEGNLPALLNTSHSGVKPDKSEESHDTGNQITRKK